MGLSLSHAITATGDAQSMLSSNGTIETGWPFGSGIETSQSSGAPRPCSNLPLCPDRGKARRVTSQLVAPTPSSMHFLVKLVRAAPDSFLSLAA